MTEKRNQKGFVLVTAVVFSFATVLLGLAFLGTAERLYRTVSRQYIEIKSTYDAYGGLGAAFAYDIERGGYGLEYRSPEIAWYDNDSYQFEIIPAGSHSIEYGTSYNTRYIVDGHSNGYEWDFVNSITSASIRESYADYLYISYTEHDSLRKATIRFWGADTLDGKVHSNDWITVMQNPLFLEKVTSCSSYIKPIGNQAILRKGFDQRPPIEFPDQAHRIRQYNVYRQPGGDFWGTYDQDSITEITFSGPFIYRRYCGPDTNNYDSIRCYPEVIADAPM